MKIKYIIHSAFYSILLLFSVFLIQSCNDNTNAVGGNVQPKNDDIDVSIDSVTIGAKTKSMEDSVYALTDYALLGKYKDPLVGDIKSDYMCEFFCPENAKFQDKTTSVDSVKLNLIYTKVTGDSISPTGITIYRLDKELKKGDFFTNQNPKDFCNMDKVLGRNIFTVQGLIVEDHSQKVPMITTTLTKSLGQEFYDEWKRSKGETFKNSDTFRKFFPGMYITNSLGTRNIFTIAYTDLNIYYSYIGRNKDNTADSTQVGDFELTETPEVMQLNHVQNKIPENIFNDTKNNYLKAPAGVYSELTIPLKEIAEKLKARYGNIDCRLNAASFMLKGNTTEESKDPDMGVVQNILLVNKDSISDFFQKKRFFNGETSFLLQYNHDNNTYSLDNDLAYIVNYYIKHYREKSEEVQDLKYMLIPVEVGTTTDEQGQKTISRLYNSMMPSMAILRTNPKEMRLRFAFSHFK